MYNSLLPYQREDVKKGVKLFGRILINDEAGMGKSLSALALTLAYRHDWPLVILCPGYVRYHWRYEILKWIPGFNFSQIQIL